MERATAKAGLENDPLGDCFAALTDCLGAMGELHADMKAGGARGLTPEGEFQTVWRDTGVPNFWIMMGNLAWCRFHSKHLALRESRPPCARLESIAEHSVFVNIVEIKAIEEGLLRNEERYV